jgi:VWFA-related protein
VSIGAAQSGTQTPAQDQRPVIRSEANFVRIDVYPTAGGVPVTDLRAEDFEVLEDGVRQNVQSFEHVLIRPSGPQDQRREPNSIEESLQMAANPRARVFIVFLDVPHVTMDGAWHIREPLIRLVDRILGPDDLVGVMTPRMAPSDVVLARKTEVMAGGLRDRWPWGERHTIEQDERERLYELCYPATDAEAGAGKRVSEVARALMHRRRERATLDALQSLVTYFRNVREERKAILTITEGWNLFRPDNSLTNLRTVSAGVKDPIPTGPPIGIDSGGKLTTRDARYRGSKSDCDADRQHLSMIDNERYFRDIIDDANRGNSSFYTVDPRGLAVWDAPIGPEKPPPPDVDQDNLKDRHDSMHELAANTDGLAVLYSNDLDKGLKRIADDLTSYYLLGYYSTNAALDGKFRSVKVRVTRPDVTVRARRGYRAATEEEVKASRAASTTVVPEALKPVNAALADLARARSDTPFRINVVPHTGAAGVSSLWIAGELRGQAASGRTAEGQVDIQISGAATGSATVMLPPGQRAFLTSIELQAPVQSGGLDVRARLNGLSVIPLTDTVKVDAASPSRALLFRRGPSTGNRIQPAGDPQFSRTERVRLELPVAAGSSPGQGRVLDRAGNPLAVPITVAERTDEATGQRWITADVTLAPLTLGEYALEVAFTHRPGKSERVITAIRVTR